MPEDQSPTVELTPEQIEFVSRYLRVTPKAHWYKRKKTTQKKLERVESENERIKRNFAEYDLLQRKTMALIADMEREAKSAGQQYRAAADADPINVNAAFEHDIAAYLSRLEDKKKKAVTKKTEVESAPVDAPIFDQGTRSFTWLLQQLESQRSTLPALPPAVIRNVAGALIRFREQAAAQKAFDGVGGLTRDIVEKPLPDAADEAKRKAELAAYDGLCDAAAGAVDALIAEVKSGSQRTDAQFTDAAEAILADLRRDCGPHIASIRTLLNAAAERQLGMLKGSFTSVADTAEREKFRLQEIDKRTARLDTAIDALGKKVDQLLVDKTKAEGFNQKRERAAEYEAEKQRLDDLRARKLQLESYKDALAGRVSRMEETQADYNHAVDIGLRPETLLGTLGKLPAAGTDAKILLLGDTKGKQKFTGAIENARNKYARAAERVSVQDMLFLGEKGLPDLAPEQLDALNAILDQAEKLCGEDKFAEAEAQDQALAQAQALVAESERLYMKFIGANKFALPPVPEIPPSKADRIEKEYKRLSVQLDRFWGRGGDASDDLRKELKGIGDRIDKAVPDDHSAILDSLKDFAGKLDKAERDFVPSPADQASRENARKAGNAIKKGLLDLFNTSPVDEAKIGEVPASRLLMIDNDDGTRSYYQIEAHKDGTETRRKDKKVPRAAMQKLLQQAQMMDALAACESPDCADMIDKAVEKSLDDLKNVRQGGPHYDHIADQLKACDKLLADKLFAEWNPAGLQDIKAKYDDFKPNYVTRMSPEDARKKVDEFLVQFKQMKTAAEQLKKDYEAVAKKLDQIETDLSNGKKASEDTLAKRLQELVKAGPEALISQLSVGPMSDVEKQDLDKLIDALKADMEVIRSKAKTLKGIEGKFTTRLAVARQTLETKSAEGVQQADAAGEKIKADMQTRIDELKALKISENGLEDFEKFAKFVGDAARGVETKIKLEQDAKGKGEALKDELDKAKAFLDKNKTTLANYNEYKNVYDSLKSQYDAITKSYEKSKDADYALSQYKLQLDSAKELNTEMSDLIRVAKGDGKTVSTDFLTTMGAALVKNIGNVQKAAGGVAARLRDRAKEDEEQAGLRDLQANVEKVAKVLELALRGEVAALAALKAGLKDDVQAAFDLPKTDPARKAAIASAREAALANIRDIRAKLDNDPALQVYRDNPFDKGQSWPHFVGTLHALEVRIIKEFDPAKA